MGAREDGKTDGIGMLISLDGVVRRVLRMESVADGIIVVERQEGGYGPFETTLSKAVRSGHLLRDCDDDFLLGAWRKAVSKAETDRQRREADREGDRERGGW